MRSMSGAATNDKILLHEPCRRRHRRRFIHFQEPSDRPHLRSGPRRLYASDFVHFMTVAELDRWAIQSKWGPARREWLRLYLERFVLLPYSRILCSLWAEVTVAAQADGRRIECADAWIAPARRHDVPLVTHNRGHYLGVPDLRVISHGE
jgi:predicted nucleic acid-binding protein